MQHPDNRIWNLLALKLSGEASPHDLAELDAYFIDHPEEKKIADHIFSFWNGKSDSVDITDEMEEERFHLILDAEEEEEKEHIPFIPVSKINGNKYAWLYV